MSEAPGRLFVPLNTRPYRDFESGQKEWEVRGLSDRFNEETVHEGRRVELRRGYGTDDSLWGTIDAVETFGMLTEIPVRIDHEKIQPGASHTECLDTLADLLGDYDRYIAFRVALDRSLDDYVDVFEIHPRLEGRRLP